jgi:hypothetical protein
MAPQARGESTTSSAHQKSLPIIGFHGKLLRAHHRNLGISLAMYKKKVTAQNRPRVFIFSIGPSCISFVPSPSPGARMGLALNVMAF